MLTSGSNAFLFLLFLTGSFFSLLPFLSTAMSSVLAFLTWSGVTLVGRRAEEERGAEGGGAAAAAEAAEAAEWILCSLMSWERGGPGDERGNRAETSVTARRVRAARMSTRILFIVGSARWETFAAPLKFG